MSDDSDKLASIRRRIANLRNLLESPDMMTGISIEGISETVDRADLRAELRELEREEAILSGSFSRIRTLDISRNW